jgi:hypothetical protein
MPPESLPKIIESDALFDSTGRHRLWLLRVWNREAPKAVFVMLNPSLGNKFENDNTIKRSIAKARYNGCGSLEIVNLYTYVTAESEDLLKRKNRGEIVSHPENNHHLKETCRKGDVIVIATGEKADWHRLKEILDLLAQIGKTAKCLGQTRSRFPRHPLFVLNNTRFVNFEI